MAERFASALSLAAAARPSHSRSTSRACSPAKVSRRPRMRPDGAGGRDPHLCARQCGPPSARRVRLVRHDALSGCVRQRPPRGRRAHDGGPRAPLQRAPRRSLLFGLLRRPFRRASAVWPAADYPYLQAAEDDVHGEEWPWTVELPLRRVQQALRRAGFDGQRAAYRRRGRGAEFVRARDAAPPRGAAAGHDHRRPVQACDRRAGLRVPRSTGGPRRHASPDRPRIRSWGRHVRHRRRAPCAARRSFEAILAKYFPGLPLTPGVARRDSELVEPAAMVRAPGPGYAPRGSSPADPRDRRARAHRLVEGAWDVHRAYHRGGARIDSRASGGRPESRGG